MCSFLDSHGAISSEHQLQRQEISCLFLELYSSALRGGTSRAGKNRISPAPHVLMDEFHRCSPIIQFKPTQVPFQRVTLWTKIKAVHSGESILLSLGKVAV